jgi:hypothetical protein
MVRIRPETGGWRSAVHLRAVFQGVITVVANSGIGARIKAIDRNPAPSILHRDSPCWKCRKLLTHDFSVIKPKLYSDGHS